MEVRRASEVGSGTSQTQMRIACELQHARVSEAKQEVRQRGEREERQRREREECQRGEDYPLSHVEERRFSAA